MRALIVILLFLFLGYLHSKAETTTAKELEFNVVEVGDTYTVYMVTDGTNVWYETVASITTYLLPEAVYGLCIITVKNPTVCSAVYAVTARLVDNNYNQVKDGITNGISWIANKGGNNKKSISKATIKTSNKKNATDAGIVFNEYKKMGNVNWNSIKNNCNCPNTYSSNGYIALYNANGYNGSASRTRNFLSKKFTNYDFVLFQ